MIVSKIGSNMTQLAGTKYTIMVSYNTPVAVYDAESNVLMVTQVKYSRTTTKHISKYRAMLFTHNVTCEIVPQSKIDSIMNEIKGV